MSWSTEIAATGFYRPKMVVDNDAYLAAARFPVAGDQTIMRTRDWCGEGETTLTMALGAVQMALAEDPSLRDELDVLIAVSSTTAPGVEAPEREHAGMGDLAPLLMRSLGRNDLLGFDVKAVNCAGFLRGLQIADGLLANPNYRAALVVASERCSGLAVSEKNRSSFCFILGDAAGAVVLRRRERGAATGLIDYVGGMDTALFHDMTILPGRDALYVRGASVGAASVKMMAANARQLLGRNQVKVDWLLPMQTHKGLVEQLRAELEWPAAKLIWHGDVTGFSGSASIPSALAEQLRKKVIRKGDVVLSLAVGAGLSSAGALYRV
ncbi:MAG TPA: 3-oxoacyl-[acyl-carrier-protein] synthase III C-terminal domain-containing protein [Myxococcales bacterium]|jgi:3-oxoacyl-[acyl-carrier-protein] synthase-3|nr:3-oxoacyl-[acyl-carrier-protein] synthase III C-terminal domain-containing protein [Myxococcales bacterium]